MRTWSDLKYFRHPEFASPDAPGSGVRMDLDFVLALDKLREAVGIPLVIVSGFRTTQHNAKVGGVECSAHTLGWAADILVLSGATRMRIVREALRLGFRRIGIGKKFVHLDVDLTKPQNVMWVYE